MARREHGALDDEHVRARLLGLLGALLGVGRHGRNRAVDARCLDRLDSIRDELRLNGFAIHLFEDRVDGSLVRGGYAIDDRLRICISRVDPVEVEHSHTAELAHRDGEVDVDHSVHRRAPDRDVQPETIAEGKRDVDLVGLERDAAGDERDLVETVSASSAPPDPDLEARLLPGKRVTGCEPALIQGVFTPMAAGFGELYEMPGPRRGNDTGPHILLLDVPAARI